jgi:putative acetyltransferase
VLLGCGALRRLGPDSGEIKAMRTNELHRRRGVGSRILEEIIAEARRRRYRWLFLETGAMVEFSAARAFYARHGFAVRGPFGDYVDDSNSVFMERML